MWSIDSKKFIDLFRYHQEAPILFTSGIFFFFFLIVSICYYWTRKNQKLRSWYLMFFLFYFYHKASGIILLVLLFTCVVNFFIGRFISNTGNNKIRKKLWLILGILVNIGVLGYFKYTNFFASIIADLLKHDFEPFDIVLPIGISFFTFQSMSYIIDIYRGSIKTLNKLVDFSFYVSFFPQLAAGPIVRAADFIPQIYSPTLVTRPMIGRALFLIMSGLFKKIVISDYISVNFVDRIFDNPSLYSGFENLMGVYAYALQIYCDFSGYSDMAIGLALLLGFHFIDNFNSPYQSSSVTEFWRRWHISPSGWLKNYLYIPLGGNKKGRFRTDLNLIITMLLGVLWHGASPLFIIWGGWHGILLVFDKLRKKFIDPLFPVIPIVQSIKHIVGVMITFNLICFGWLLFRADSMNTVKLILTQITHSFHIEILPSFVSCYSTVMLIILGGYLLHFMPNKYEQMSYEAIANQSVIVKATLFALFIFFPIQVRSSEILPFIYFQF